MIPLQVFNINRPEKAQIIFVETNSLTWGMTGILKGLYEEITSNKRYKSVISV